MSVTSSTDPVQAVKDILDNMTSADWSNLGDTPDRIEFAWTSEPSEKAHRNRRQEAAIYVESPVEGTFSPESTGVDHYTDSQAVLAQVRSGNESKTVNTAADIKNHFITNYWTDNSQQSNWRIIRPNAENDLRSQGFYRGSFFIINVTLTLEALRTT